MKYEFKGSKNIEARFLENDDDFICELSSNGVPIAAIYHNNDIAEHDAHLISAAPDLLQAAIDTLQHFLQIQPLYSGDKAILSHLKTAIHKALNIEG